MYGVPYMEAQVAQPLELRLRGFSPRELNERAKAECAARFGAGGFSIEECRCVPCVCSLGGHVRLYEAHVLVRPIATPATS